MAAALFAAAQSPAMAQRVFVAAQGSDGNPCSFALPCRTFQHAHDTVAAGGEIDVLDPAGYGSVNITKAISIQGHGFSGISVAPGTAGVSVNAGANDAVNLNGLLIEGSAAGNNNGIVFNNGRSLVIESCVVRNMVGDGLDFVPAGSNAATLSISNSMFADSVDANVKIAPPVGSGAVTVSIDRSSFLGSGIGVWVVGSLTNSPVNVAISDSVAANNATNSALGISVVSTNATTSVMLSRVLAAGNFIGVASNGNKSTLRIGQSTVTGNATGYAAQNGGTILSYGDNYIDGNGTDTGTIGSASTQ
jgi:hypothetical protein